MKRGAMIFLLMSVLAVPLLVTTPAAAKACSGQGNMHLSRKIGLPVVGAQSNVSYSLALKCTVGGAIVTAFGNIVSASCGRMKSGTGTINGKPFKFQGVGTLGIATGTVTGVFNMVPDVRRGDACQSGTADDFLITAAFNGL